MRDSRLDLFSSQPVTVNSATTTNGNDFDLLDNYVGDYWQGTEFPYGLGMEVLINNIDGAAGVDEMGVEVKIQVADDDGAGNPDTYEDDAIVYSTDSIEDDVNDNNGTKVAIPFRVHTARQWFRIVVVTTINAGTSSEIDIQGWFSDGASRHSYATQVRY